tara:strand:+ start:4241 stop:5581 length:1341 start_codon:yes stop_codon:yes gene_type:complete
MSRRKRKFAVSNIKHEAYIESLSSDCRGIAKINSKITYIHGGLPGEKIFFKYTRKRDDYDEGLITDVIHSSPKRVVPQCNFYKNCGGCNLQHLSPESQILSKQKILLDELRNVAYLEPETILPPITNENTWGYRRKARLGVKWVQKKNKVLVGFRERQSSFIADVDMCHILHPSVGKLLNNLSETIKELSIRDKIPQIEVIMDDLKCVLVFRVLKELNVTDKKLLIDFGKNHQIFPYIQTGGPKTIQPLDREVDLYYELPNQTLKLNFLPGDFTQINSQINRKMVTRAVDLLRPEQNDRILDLFCGMGNFSLALAKHASFVYGLEGDEGLIDRAILNAKNNQINNIKFKKVDLYKHNIFHLNLGAFNKALIDPPRSGASSILKCLSLLGVEKILYISCYPKTLAEDAKILTKIYGYKLKKVGVMDMFPHTAHVESLAFFELNKNLK